MRASLGALLMALLAVPAMAGALEAEYLGRHIWSDSSIGGLSGLEVSPDGTYFIAISDRGTRHEGRFLREEERITGLEVTAPVPIRKLNGQPATGRAMDAEGLACARPAPRASCDISFEVIHRVAYFSDPEAAAKNRPRPAMITALQRNSGLEALAMDPEGRLLAIPERSGDLARPFPVLRLENGRWSIPFALRRDPPYLVVGADFGPDGKLYVLERHFTTIAFRSRVRRFTLANDRVLREETVLTSPLGRFDNLEGISVWRDNSGAIRLTMVSDDNFNRFQRNEFIEYRLREDDGSG